MNNNLLLYNSGGGIGDAIQILPLIETLKTELKNENLYYLSAHNNHFNSTLKDFNCQINTLDLNIKYFCFRWWHTLIVRKRIKSNNIEKFKSVRKKIINKYSKIQEKKLLINMINKIKG